MNQMIKRLLATGAISVVFLSQSLVADMIDYYNQAILPSIVAKKSNAKDDMALNAILYPKVAAISNSPVCFGSIDQVKECVDLLSLAAPKPPVGGVEPAEGNNACTSGSFDYSHAEDGTYTIVFRNCVDDANARRLQEDLVVRACIYNRKPKLLPGNSGPTGTYNVRYNGTVTCSPYVKTASNYTYRTIGNSDTKPKMQWQYNVSLDLTSKVDINGTVRGITKYGTQFDGWDEMNTTSDEEWQFDNLYLALGIGGEKYTFDGKYTYIKHPNSAPNPNPDPVGYTFYMDFKELSYIFTHNDADMDANVSGKVDASCHKYGVTYATKTIMEDLDTIRDINGSRMPSLGQMTSAVNAYNVATATFSAAGNAQASVVSRDGTEVYDAWREIVNGSSCQAIQDTLDDIWPNPNPPAVHDEIVTGNILFEKDLDKSGTVPPPVSGHADGHAVWYYVSPGHGYKADGSQKVSETYFDYDVTKSGSSAGVYVNAYFKDSDGNKVQAVIVQNPNNSIENCKNADSNGNYHCTWGQMKSEHGDWTIRADYFELNWSPFAAFNGNFILRIGDSSYTGTDPFVINNYDLHEDNQPQ